MVKADTVILELSNPDAERRRCFEAEQQLKAAEAQLASTRVRVAKRGARAGGGRRGCRPTTRQARMQAEADAELAKEGLVSSLTTKLSQVKADNLETRNDIEQKRLSR